MALYYHLKEARPRGSEYHWRQLRHSALFSAIQRGKIESSIAMLKDIQHCASEVKEMDLRVILNMSHSETLRKILAPTADIILKSIEEQMESHVSSVHRRNYFCLMACVMEAKESRDWFQPNSEGKTFSVLVQLYLLSFIE